MAMRNFGSVRLAAAAALAAALLSASGCSTWRELTGQNERAGRQPPGAQGAYPNLGSVPNRHPETGSTRERLRIEEGLLADRQNARHVDGPVAGTDSASGLPEAPDVRPTIIDPRTAGPAGARATGGNIGSIAFRPGSNTLPEGSGRMIVRAAEIHRRYGGTLVVVGNAAQGEGDAAARRAAAQARANLVVNGLVNLGVPRNQIRAGAGGANAARVDIAIQGITRR